MLITGLRGVGKTVLLGAFESRARASGWVTVTAEITKNEEFGARMGSMVRRALFQVGPKNSWTDKLRQAAAALKSFSITVAPDGSVTAGIDIEPLEGTADSGNLSDDLTDLLVTLGEAAQERETGIAFLVDEVQFLRAAEFEALIAGLHRTVQRQLPITLVGAGLPQLPRLAGEAKSYAERLFKFPRIGELTPPQAEAALAEPAAEQGVTFDAGAIDVIVNYTEGYPYFIQEYGKIVWDLAPEGEPISEPVAREAQRAVGETRRVVLPRPRRTRDRTRASIPTRDGGTRPRRTGSRRHRRRPRPHLRPTRPHPRQPHRQRLHLHHQPRPRRLHRPPVRQLHAPKPRPRAAAAPPLNQASIEQLAASRQQHQDRGPTILK